MKHLNHLASYAQLRALMPAPGHPVDWGACCEAIPPLSRLDATPQDPVHHAEGDVGLHTRMVLAALQEDAYFQAAAVDRQWVMFMAALLHDLAKPDTTLIDPITGRISQPGHSRRGAIDARVLLWQAGAPVALREAICRLIAVHQVPFFAFSARDGRPAEYLVRKLSWELVLAELVALARADMRGRHCASLSQNLEDIALFEALIQEEGAWQQPAHFADSHTAISYFRGANLYPSEPLHQRAGSRVTVMCGLPASGKNTWVARHRAGWPVVSFDDSREALGLAHGKSGGVVAHHVWDQAQQLLRQRTAFVWNATHLSVSMRSKSLQLLYDYDAEVEIIHLEQALPELLRRNARRDTSLSNQRLLDMLKRWEVPTPTEAHRVALVSDESLDPFADVAMLTSATTSAPRGA